MMGSKICKKYGCKIRVNGDNEYCGLHRISSNSRNKYNAVRQTYNNYNYDSKLEAKYAYELDLRIKIGEVEYWERQHKLRLNVNGIHICNYYVDFKVIFTDGRIEYHEVKGVETILWRIKWRISKALYPDHKFVLIK